jgi:DNA-binding response OmpR family regulator
MRGQRAGLGIVQAANVNTFFIRPEPKSGHRIVFMQTGLRRLEEQPIILVAEDDQQLQSLIEDTLTEGGFEAAIAQSGEEAVTLLRGRQIGYRALVTDFKLRGSMNGWEVAKQARQIEPSFPVIYMTGASADKWAVEGVPNSILLTKPFAPAQLVTAISQLLKTGTPNTPRKTAPAGKD